KTYKYLSPDTYRALYKRGDEVGLEISGEIPISVRRWEASKLGQRTGEHLSGVEIACSRQEEERRMQYRRHAEKISADTTLNTQVPDWIRTEWEPINSVDPARCRVLYEYLAAHDTWVVPTLMIQRVISFSSDLEIRNHPGQHYLPEGGWDQE